MSKHAETVKTVVENVGTVVDAKTVAGIGVGTGSFFIYLSQWMPVVGMIMTFVISVMTVIYLKKGLKIRDQEIQINERKLRRATDNPMCEPD
jgi:CHASE2 domain-containing sensor protein